MQNGGGRLKLGYSGEVKMRRGGGDPRGNTVESVPHGAGASDCPICPEAGAPHGHTGLKGYHPPFLELEPDRILRDRTSQGCTESNPDLCLSNTRVSCGSALSRETTSHPNIRVGSLLGWAVPVPRSQPREQSSHQMSCRTKIIRYKIKSDSWETLHKHRKIGNCIFQVSLRINQCV